MAKERIPAKEVSTAQLMEMLAQYVKDAGEGVFAMVYKAEKKEWLVSMEFGREAPDSPMAGGAAYGIGELRKALETAAHDCGLIQKEESGA